jgi:hypothetical protein
MHKACIKVNCGSGASVMVEAFCYKVEGLGFGDTMSQLNVINLTTLSDYTEPLGLLSL